MAKTEQSAASAPLKNLISDWGGFEKLVAQLHETGSVQVQHNVILTGKSGAPRQIDVVIRHREGLYDHLIIVECKYWKDHVSRLHVDALKTAVDELNASRGVIFSINGFQEGAVTEARHAGIELFQVRELTDQEWGLPGRKIDFYLQTIIGSFGNFVLHTPTVMSKVPAVPQAVSVPMHFNERGPESSTSLMLPDGQTAQKTLETYIWDSAKIGLSRFTPYIGLVNDGADGTGYFVAQINILPDKPFAIPQGDILILIPKVSFDLGIKVSQTRMQFDRAEKYLFALAIENCVNGTVSSAARSKTDPTTELNLLPPPPEKPPEGVLVNGSIMKVVTNVLFPFQEMADKNPIKLGAGG